MSKLTDRFVYYSLFQVLASVTTTERMLRSELGRAQSEEATLRRRYLAEELRFCPSTHDGIYRSPESLLQSPLSTKVEHHASPVDSEDETEREFEQVVFTRLNLLIFRDC